jgi:hypothetical protein
VGYTDLGAVLIRARVFDELEHRFLGNNRAIYSQTQEWWLDREDLQAKTDIAQWGFVRHYSHMLDGVFYEAMALMPGVTSVTLAEVLFLHL